MNTKRIAPTLAGLGFLALIVLVGVTSGCVAYAGPHGGLRVGFAPPALRIEAGIAAPGAGFVWVPGYYDWRGSDYFWVGGAWVRPPHARAVWVAPRYYQRRGGWYYSRGYWR
jgi:WXXGXW repeat (2 copies)